MKLNTFSRLFLVTVLIAFTQCSKLNRIKTGEKSRDGEGSWANGFLCPFIYMASKGQELRDQGAGRFYPSKFVDGNEAAPEDKIGFVIDFTNVPGDIVKTKVGVKITEKKFYIPFRFFSSKLDYKNPSGWNNKYFLGTLTNDNGEDFQIKIILPWARVTWYINDTEAHKVADKIVSLAGQERSSIKNIKDDLLTEFSKLKINKPLLETSQQNFADLAKALEDNKKALETNKQNANSLDTQIDEINKQINELLEKIKPLQARKDSLSSDYKVITEIIANSERALSEKSGGASTQQDAIKVYKPLVEDSNRKVDKLVGDMSVRAPEKNTTVIAGIKTSIVALNQEDLKTNFSKIRSN